MNDLSNLRAMERTARRERRAACLQRQALEAYRDGDRVRGRRLERLYFIADGVALKTRWERTQ